MAIIPGTHFDRYEILSVLGAGGMGEVYLAYDKRLGRKVAIKTLPEQYTNQPDRLMRFEREARAASALNHPNIVTILDIGEADGVHFMAHEYVEGESLRERLSMGRLSPIEGLEIAIHIASALGAAHEAGILHRDIKPDNVILRRDGFVKVLDFGLAKLTEGHSPGVDKEASTIAKNTTDAGAVMGTPQYMSPEQARGKEVDARTDIFSLGVTMYEMLAGRAPFAGETPTDVIIALVDKEPAPIARLAPNAPADLHHIINKALRKNREERYESVKSLLADLKALKEELEFAAKLERSSPPESHSSPPEAEGNDELDLAHVLFCDIVGYSLLPIDEQTRMMRRLQEIVRQTEDYRRAEASHQLVRLPAGDGMALAFLHDPAAPVRCAFEIARSLKAHPEIRLRMGVHTGPVFRSADINANRNVVGSGINLAQRVMDCGDAGHILVSSNVAETLGQVSRWQPFLHDLGEVEVKHGVKLHLFNLYTDEGGNAETPSKLKGEKAAGARNDAISGARISVVAVKRHKLGVSLALAAVIISTFAAYLYFNRSKPALTDKDTILIAEFDNRTGDAVFDGTLRQGLAVQLQQSPFLDLFSDARTRQTLRLMGHSPDDRITQEIGREICQRQGLKALIAGSIASLGSHYVITLESVSGLSGESLAREQVEAESKEQVLKALSQAASKLRERLGESLSSLQRFDAPLQVTTSSLEALKAYSLASGQASSGKWLDAIPHFNRAEEIDPNFASAYSGVAVSYANTGQLRLAAENAVKAYALRDRVSEVERFRISSFYYQFVTGELDKYIEVLELYKQTYPRDDRPYTNLSVAYDRIGQWEKSAEEAREAIRINPNTAAPQSNLARAYIRLNRYDESVAALDRAMRQSKLDGELVRTWVYLIAFIRGDSATMKQQIDWMAGKQAEYIAFDWQTGSAAFVGQWRRSQDFSRRAIELATRNGVKEVAAQYAAEAALRAAIFGQCAQTKAVAAQALSIEHTQVSLTRSGLALALCGEVGHARSLVEELTKEYPKFTVINGIWLPTIRAALALGHGDSSQALQELQVASRYEAAGEFWPQYLRGQAYLKSGQGKDAAGEFQKILGSRGQAPLSALYPLAHLGLARAAALQNDLAKSRQAYDAFFALWKDADADLPILIEAKKEYEKLK